MDKPNNRTGQTADCQEEGSSSLSVDRYDSRMNREPMPQKVWHARFVVPWK